MKNIIISFLLVVLFNLGLGWTVSGFTACLYNVILFLLVLVAVFDIDFTLQEHKRK